MQNIGYAAHRSQWARLEGSDSWAELAPAFGYSGTKLRASRLLDGQETVMDPRSGPKTSSPPRWTTWPSAW